MKRMVLWLSVVLVGSAIAAFFNWYKTRPSQNCFSCVNDKIKDLMKPSPKATGSITIIKQDVSPSEAPFRVRYLWVLSGAQNVPLPESTCKSDADCVPIAESCRDFISVNKRFFQEHPKDFPGSCHEPPHFKPVVHCSYSLCLVDHKASCLARGGQWNERAKAWGQQAGCTPRPVPFGPKR